MDLSILDVNNKEDLNIIIEHMNKELLKGRSQKDIEINDFKVNERVIGKRLNRKGFKKVNNQFVFLNDNESDTSVINKGIVVNEVKNISLNNEKDIRALKELIELVEPIKALLQKSNQSDTVVTIEPIELKPRAVNSIKQKNFKIDVDVLEKWDKFVEEHKEYKVQQLISLALDEFIEKYS